MEWLANQRGAAIKLHISNTMGTVTLLRNTTTLNLFTTTC